MTATDHKEPAGRRLGASSARSGAWIVTYADLMTILVCFFVLIISFSIQDRVKMEVVAGSMRDAFGVAEQRRYAGERLLEGVIEKRQPGDLIRQDAPTADGLVASPSARPQEGAQGERQSGERADPRARLRAEAAALERAILTHPLLRDGAETIRVAMDEDGVQIILTDGAGAPMFAYGASEPSDAAKAKLAAIARLLAPLANRLVIEGHADAGGAGTHSSFALTARRAEAARRIFEEAGFPAARIAGISGRGAAEPLFPADPFAGGNRRIEIRLQKAAPLLPAERSL